LRNDCAGIAACHIAGTKEVIRTDAEYRPIRSLAPIVHVDFMIRVRPPGGSEIDIGKLRSFVFYLMELGMPIQKVTLDSFQSADTIQIFLKSNMEAELLSLDRKPDAYLAFKSALMENRVSYYKYEPFLDEVTMLQFDRIKRKIDHPETGSKDVADAVAGSFMSCIMSEFAQTYLSDPSFIVGSKRLDRREAEMRLPQKKTGGEDWVYGDYPDAALITNILKEDMFSF
jgi:hypothetical protein